MPKTYLERDTAGTPQQSFVTLPGGAQTISLLGPFHVTFETPDINNVGTGGALLAELGADDYIVSAWMVVTALWEFATAGTVSLAVAPTAEPTNVYSIVDYYAVGTDPRFIQTQGEPAVVVEANSISAVTSGPVHYAARFTEAGRLVVIATGADPSSGEADIFALVATPA